VPPPTGSQESLQLVLDALRLSAHVVRRDPTQLAGQLVGRLLSSDDTAVTRLLQQVREWKSAPWLRPLSATLMPAGGPLQRILEGHRGEVWALALTPDGRRAVSASLDKTLRVWDLEQGEALRTLEGHDGEVWAWR
jgi:WD40 repeat protein